MENYNIIYSKRKTLMLRINKDGSLEVRAPNNYPKEKIEEFVKSKENWINKHQEKVKEKHQLRGSFNINYGDTVRLRGKRIPITPIKKEIAEFKNDEFFIYENLDKNNIKELIIKLYKNIAKYHITSRVNHFKEIMNLKPRAIRITSAKTRWGSCSNRHSINFSWRLIMAEDDVIDYVVVHELAHIKQPNHSKEFWKIVEEILPDYKERKNKLKQLGKELLKENWG
ncbi:MAG: M48 family metallopeptidase [Methanobrevibacter sp.]|jgi:predicted metal-dependent hydrolase|nr:M48 family metallopeptidase [Methanobrevibacter sp.]